MNLLIFQTNSPKPWNIQFTIRQTAENRELFFFFGIFASEKSKLLPTFIFVDYPASNWHYWLQEYFEFVNIGLFSCIWTLRGDTSVYWKCSTNQSASIIIWMFTVVTVVNNHLNVHGQKYRKMESEEDFHNLEKKHTRGGEKKTSFIFLWQHRKAES